MIYYYESELSDFVIGEFQDSKPEFILPHIAELSDFVIGEFQDSKPEFILPHIAESSDFVIGEFQDSKPEFILPHIAELTIFRVVEYNSDIVFVEYSNYDPELKSIVFGYGSISFPIIYYESEFSSFVFTETSSKIYFTLKFEGALEISSSGEFDYYYAFDFYNTVFWNLNQSTSRYYRVEGSPKPFTCPPVQGEVCPCVKYIVNIQARSVSEVCQKLRERNFKGPIKKIQVFSLLPQKSGEPIDCIELTDVSSYLLPDCIDLLVEHKGLISIKTTFTGKIIYNQFYSPVINSPIVSRVSADVESSSCSYDVGFEGISFGGEAEYFSPENPIVSSDIYAFVGGSADYSCSHLGLYNISIPFSFVFDVKVNYAFDNSGETLTLNRDTTTSSCCGVLPTILYLSHIYDNFNKFNNFLFINNLVLNRNLRLVFNNKTKKWTNEFQAFGISPENNYDEKWVVVTEIGCKNNLDGISLLQSNNAWSFSFLFSLKKDNKNYYSRISADFDPVNFCTFDLNRNYSINREFILNTATKRFSPETLRNVAFNDEIGLFKGTAFARNPFVSFFISSSEIFSEYSTIDLSKNLEIFKNV